MTTEQAAAQTTQNGKTLKLKTLEVILIDGLIIAGTLLLDRFNMWAHLDLPLKTPEEIEAARNASPPFIPLLALATAIVLVYAMARKSKPENAFLQIFYAIGLMGVMFTCAGIPALLFNSVIMCLPGLLFGYVVVMLHEGGAKGLMQFVNSIYDNPSRVIILPVAAYLYVSGMEYLLQTRISPMYSWLLIIMIYLPVRLMLMFKEPYRPYYFLSMTAAFVVFTYSSMTSLMNSPAEPVWYKLEPYLGDSVRIIEQESDRAVVCSNIPNNGKYHGITFFIVTKDASGKWVVSEQITGMDYLSKQK